MAQHDYILDNAAGAAFRSDLNNALAAVVSLNSGASEPSTTYAFMLWYDTTNSILKIRNSADSAWTVFAAHDPVVKAKTSAYTVVLADSGALISGDASGGAWALTLGAAGTLGDGYFLYVEKSDAGANAVTITPDGSELIDGAATEMQTRSR